MGHVGPFDSSDKSYSGSVSRANTHANTRRRARGTPTRVDAMSASDIERLRALLVAQRAAAESAMERLDACVPPPSVEDDLFGPDDESARGAEAERASALRALAATVHADLSSWTETWREFAGVAPPSNPAPAPAPFADPAPDASARPLGSRKKRPPTSVAGAAGASAPVPAPVPAPAPAPGGDLFGDDDDDDGGLFGAPAPAPRAPAASADSFAPPGAPFAAPPATGLTDQLDAVAAEPEAPAKPRTMMGMGPMMGGLSLGELKQRIGSRGSAPAPPDADGGEHRADPGEPRAGPGGGDGPGVVVVPMVAPPVAGGGKPAWMVELAAKKKAKAAAEAAAAAAAGVGGESGGAA